MKKSWIEINLDRLRSNVRSIRSCLADGVAAIFVVKADAYGHGLEYSVRTAVEEGIDWFAVAYLDEALAVRRFAPESNILILGVVAPEDVPVLIDNNITPIVVSCQHGEELNNAAEKAGGNIHAHIKLDTGMGRLGIAATDFPQAAEKLVGFQRIQITGLCSHFSMVEPDHPEFADRQVHLFRKAGELLDSLVGRKTMKHISSSRACLYKPEWDFDAVRLGIVVYGYGAASEHGRFKTEPILQWKTTVMQVRTVPAGCPVSYYGTYVTETSTQLAVIALGYADGYLRTLSNRGYVLIRGRRYPVVGRVTMNWICIDLGASSDVREGDEVVLLGEQGDESVWAGELARYCHTIPYEIVTGIHPSIARKYYDRGLPL